MGLSVEIIKYTSRKQTQVSYGQHGAVHKCLNTNIPVTRNRRYSGEYREKINVIR